MFLECDQRTLALSSWPQAIRNDPSSLDKCEYNFIVLERSAARDCATIENDPISSSHTDNTTDYKLAADMLQPERYPESFPTPRKLNVLQKQAKALGLEKNFSRPPQTTFFHDGLNCAGVQMKKSTGSGQDMTGVNDGSKNSVLVTYIADAWNWGAEIFCECEVRYIRKEPEDKGYTIFFAWHGDGRGSFRDEFYTQLMWVRAVRLKGHVEFVMFCLLTFTARNLFSRCWSARYHGDTTSLKGTRSSAFLDGRPETLW